MTPDRFVEFGTIFGVIFDGILVMGLSLVTCSHNIDATGTASVPDYESKVSGEFDCRKSVILVVATGNGNIVVLVAVVRMATSKNG